MDDKSGSEVCRDAGHVTFVLIGNDNNVEEILQSALKGKRNN
jgi:hypothetical protein